MPLFKDSCTYITVARGRTLYIEITLKLESATQAGLRLAAGEGTGVLVGYDTQTKSVYVDRRQSGLVDMHPGFSGVHSAPIPLERDRTIALRIILDWSSVEVFGGKHGEVSITDLIYPTSSTSDLVQLFVQDGDARVQSMRLWELKAYRSNSTITNK
jgi:levanase